MKTNKEMSQQDSEQAPVTFHDVAASFSEDEWKLLHQWQEELYRNVMKGIHQAFISIGPLIATSVFSLRAKEKENLCLADHQDSERRHADNHSLSTTVSHSDVSRRSREEKQYLKDPHNRDRLQSSDHLGTGFPSLNSGIISRMEQEVEGILMDGPATRGGQRRAGGTIDNADVSGIKGDEKRETNQRKINDRLSTGSPSLNTERGARFMDHIGAEGGESSASCNSGFFVVKADETFKGGENNSDPNPGQEVITPVVPLSIKEEGGAYFMDHEDSERKETINMCTGINSSINSNEQQRASDWERTSMGSECGGNFTHKIDVINSYKIKPGEALHAHTGYESSFSQRSNPVKQKKAHTGQRPYAWTECGKSFKESATLSPHQEIHTQLKLYICSKCGNCFNQSANETSHHQINEGNQQNTCAECEKSFYKSTNLNKDQEKNMGEKPYICMVCEKSFRKSQSLIIHRRVHTGEKPYTCSHCGKNFRQIQHLVKHRRMHTGEKPYACYLCERRFINSSNLKRHQQIHTREVESVTWATEG